MALFAIQTMTAPRTSRSPMRPTRSRPAGVTVDPRTRRISSNWEASISPRANRARRVLIASSSRPPPARWIARATTSTTPTMNTTQAKRPSQPIGPPPNIIIAPTILHRA
jgi:hypothetical protein